MRSAPAIFVSAPQPRAFQAEEEEVRGDLGFDVDDDVRVKAEMGATESEAESEFETENDEPDKNPMEAKQTLLHILATGIIMNTRLNDEMSCFRTTFKAWNTLLPHDTVLTVLDFYGVS